MSFDPSLYYQHGNITGPDQTTDTGAGASLGPDPSQDPTQNEYYTQRLLTPPWITAGFTDYASYARNLQEKEANARAIQERQIAAGSAAAGVSASITTQGANQRAAVQAEIDRAKNASDAAHQQALDALAQGNAAEARRQFDISSSELQRYHTLDTGIRQQEANSSATTAGYNIYKDLTDKSSNPRNFMEQFFTHRGQPAPPNAGQYSNTPTGPQGIMPFEQFLPGFMRNIGLQGYGYGSPSSGAGAGSPPAASAPPPPGGYGGQGNPANPYAGTNMNYGGSPTTADTAMINGVKTWAGGAYSGKPVDQSPANAGDLTPYLQQGQAAGQARMMAQGGQVTMNAPHALVNLLTGRVAAIAGEAGKEHAKFDGAAIIDPLKTQSGVPFVAPDGTPTPATTPDTTPPPPNTTSTPTPPPGGDTFPQPSQLPGASTAPSTTAAPIPGLGTQAPPPGFHWVGQQLVPDATTTLPPPPPPVIPPTPPPVPPPVTTFTQPNVPVNSWGGPQIAPTTPTGPASFNVPSFLQSTPSGLGQNPTFLPEEAGAQDPLVKAMIDAGSFPPFLQRLYAQAKGLPGLGTNTPQATDLPAGVPLVSKLAYNQMSPSEQQAFASFLSAHGITIEDYLSMVEAASPQGGTSPRNPAVPKFLSQGG